MTIYTKHWARRGVTLIEAVLFISIALGLIVGGLVFFQQASLAARINDAVRSLSGMASETRAAYRTQQTFAGLTETVLISSGAVPSSQVRVNPVAGAGEGATAFPNIIVNEWNNRVTIRPNAAATPAGSTVNQFLEITYTDIPVAACTRLATATGGNGPIGPGIVSVRVVNSSAVPVTTVIGAVDLNGRATITPAAAATACATGDAPVDVTFTLAR